METAYSVSIASGIELLTAEMIPYVADQLGRNVPQPFYRGFPDSVRELTEEKLLFDQIISYVRTYGMNNFDKPVHSLFEQVCPRRPFAEEVEKKTFTVITETDAIEILKDAVEDLLATTRPLSESQFVFVCEFIREYDYNIQMCASKNTAIKLLLTLKNPEYANFLSMSDVIKFVGELNYERYGKKNIRKLNLRNQDRKFITNVIDCVSESESKIDTVTCYERKKDWCGLLHHIHYQPKNNQARAFVNAMRGKVNLSIYSGFEAAMNAGDIQSAVAILKNGKGTGALVRNLYYLVSRCKSTEDIMAVVEAIGTENKIVLFQILLKLYFETENKVARNFCFTRYNKMVIHRETSEETERRKSHLSPDQTDFLYRTINRKLENALNGTLGKVYISPEMFDVALPIQENTASGGFGILPKGSRIHIPEGKKIRAFTYWEKVDDIDLSCFGIDSNGNQMEFSWRTMYHNQSDAITYSGDETSGYHGGSEYFDINVEEFRKKYPAVEYIVFCNNVFSNLTFDKCVCRAGYMTRDINDSGEVYEPKTVKSSFTINANSTFAYLFAIDLNRNDFIWLNISRDSSCHVAGTTQMDFLEKYFNMTDVLNVGRLFGMLATEIVYRPLVADVIVADDIQTYNPKKEIIHSYDIEKIMAYMN